LIAVVLLVRVRARVGAESRRGLSPISARGHDTRPTLNAAQVREITAQPSHPRRGTAIWDPN
jgi:hypothetical protein